MLSQKIHFLASEIMPHHLNVSITKFCQSIRATGVTVNIQVGPVVVRVDVPPGPVAAGVSRRFQGWAAGKTPCAVLDVHLEPGSDAVDLSQAPLRVEATRFSWTHKTCHLTVDAETRLGRLEGACARPIAVVEYALRCLVALCAWRHAALLVHASAVGVGNQAVLFIGPSGAGKSTDASLRPPSCLLLADDLVMAELAPEGWRAWPTPFEHGGAVESTAPRRIGLLCVPVHAERPALVPLSPEKALAHLLESLPLIAYYRPALEFLLPRLRACLLHTPMVALHFAPTPDFWPLILRALGEHRHVAP